MGSHELKEEDSCPIIKASGEHAEEFGCNTDTDGNPLEILCIQCTWSVILSGEPGKSSVCRLDKTCTTRGEGKFLFIQAILRKRDQQIKLPFSASTKSATFIGKI